jgi:Tol biopolymer transport system component
MDPRAACLRIAVLAAGVALFPSGQAGAAELISRVERVSASASAESRSPSLSADGRYVAFQSNARNLVAGQATGPYGDVFLRDRVTGTNVLVSHVPGSATTGGDILSYRPTLSADGSVVLFISSSRNLVAGQADPDETDDLFLYERATGNVVLVSHSVSSAATPGNGTTYPGSLASSDGRYIVFQSEATDLVAGQTDTNNEPEIYLYDRVAGTTGLVSHKPAQPSAAGNAGAAQRGMTADGRFILLSSYATDLVPGQSGLFLYDRTSDSLTHIAEGVGAGTISADGNFIAVLTHANLVPGQTDPGDPQNVFLYDRQAGTFALVSHAISSAVTSGNGWSFQPVISADGRYVAFQSDATDLISGQTGTLSHHLYLYDRLSGTNTLVTHSSGSPTALANHILDDLPVLSPDGRYIAYASYASDLVAGQADTNSRQDVFLYDRTTNASTLVSHIPGSAATTGSDRSPAPLAMGGDGRWIAFASDAADLADDDFNAARDVFLYDAEAGAPQLASTHDPAAPALTGLEESQFADLSDNGRYVLFHSPVSHMAEGVTDGNGTYDVFLRDRATGDTVLVSESASTPATAANASSQGMAISADGRWVAFGSGATDLVAGQTDLYQTGDLFLWDRMTGARTLVTHASSSSVTTANAGPLAVALSADGRYVAFESQATNLVTGQIDAPWDSDVFVFDRTTGASSLISHKAGAPLTAAGGSSLPSISADGRWVAFISTAPDLVPGLTLATNYFNIYLHDRSTGTTTLVSRAAGPGLEAGNAISYGNSLSLDGRFLAFYSEASNLVPGQITGNNGNTFLYDHATGSTSLVSHVPGSTTQGGNHFSSGSTVSPEGTFVIFGSFASNLVAGQVDTAGLQDIFRYDRRTGAVTLVSHTPDSPVTAGNAESSGLAVGADGTVVYMSQARNLVPGQVDTAGTDDVFRYDPATGANRLLTGAFSSATQATGGVISRVALSRNGRVALFNSRSPSLVDGDYNKVFDVFADEAPDTASDFYTVEPCRLLDTRNPGDGPALASGTVRLMIVHGACGIPATARALAVNVTVIGATGSGNLKLYPSGLLAPGTSTINFAAGQTRANNALVSLTPGVERGLAAFASVGGGGTVHVLLDVTGYFE